MAAPLIVHADINAPPSTIWSAVTDLDRIREHMPAITAVERLEQGPMRVGSRWRETRVMYGKQATETLEVTAMDPPRSYAVGTTNHGCIYRSVVTVEPLGTGSRVSISFGADAVSGFAKLMMLLMGPLMRGSVRTMLQNDVDALKASLEKQPGARQ